MLKQYFYKIGKNLRRYIHAEGHGLKFKNGVVEGKSSLSVARELFTQRDVKVCMLKVYLCTPLPFAKGGEHMSPVVDAKMGNPKSSIGPYGEHNQAYQEYPPKTAILAHVPSRSVCPWDMKK